MNTNVNSEGLFDCLDNHNMDNVKVEIFLCLDYKSLHIARQVSKGWQNFIDKKIWSLRKSHAMRLLAREWRNNEPVPQSIECPNNLQDILVDDNILLVESFKKIEILEPLTGKSIYAIPGLFNRIHGDLPTVHGTKDISSRIIAIGMAGHGSATGQVVILDRKSLRLVCSVHLPLIEETLPNDSYGFVEHLRCVKIVGDFIVAGGFDGILTAFSHRSILFLAAPNKGVFNDLDGSPLEIGFWHFTDLYTIEDTVTKKMDDSIKFMEKDGTWFLVISNKNGELWDFSRGPYQKTMIEGLSGMVDHVTDSALKYPYAFFATRYEGELIGQKLVEILDIENNQLMRKIKISDHSLYNRGHSFCITLNGNILATKIQFDRVCDVAEAKIFIHDIEELVNPALSNGKTLI